jgi:hypothetical protein
VDLFQGFYIFGWKRKDRKIANFLWSAIFIVKKMITVLGLAIDL